MPEPARSPFRFPALLITAYAALSLALSACSRPTVPAAPSPATLTPPSSALRLFETPRDGPTPVLDAIRGAHHAVDVQIYELTDSGVLQALVAEQQSGTSVRVILNRDFPTGGHTNDAAFNSLSSAGVSVKWASRDFGFTHEKSIIVDPNDADQQVLIMTMNLSPGYLGEPDREGESLNFGVVDTLSSDVAQAEAIFSADWAGQKYAPPADTPLVVSPTNSRQALLGQIQGASRSLHLFAQELTDKGVVDALIASARRGVDVKGLLANNIAGNETSAGRLRAAGGQIRYLAKPYEHAKATISDAASVYLGSINYTATSLDSNRELGILTRQSDIAAQMEAEFSRFWAQGSEEP